ncbi:hypothetical protein BASA81_008545 [Batrachochytrium salamandrivorans]|nr:hypothetical protein BASA81_008545 [Batrachochytrium salamandrivorans]
MWFRNVFGVREAGKVEEAFRFFADAGRLACLSSGREFACGQFSTPDLHSLREQVQAAREDGTLQFEHVATGDIFLWHAKHPQATFQVASQFNCLEFPDPNSVPSDGITNYVYDQTQGPACSVVCAPATLVRNYFVGQTDDNQINNLQDLEQALGEVGQYFDVRNGYVDSDSARIQLLNQALDLADRNELLGLIRVGWHRQCQVVFATRDYEVLSNEVLVSQVFCSAISCAYAAEVSLEEWELLAQLVLDAAYEATLLCAYLDKVQGVGNGKVFLTLLGGGVFGGSKH